MTAKRFYRNQKVKINNPISYKRNGEVATVKWTPEYDSDYVTVVFSDGCSGKYHKNKLLLDGNERLVLTGRIGE